MEEEIDISKYLLHTDSDNENSSISFKETESTTSDCTHRSGSTYDNCYSTEKLLSILQYLESSKEIEEKIENEYDRMVISKIVNNLKGHYFSLIYGKRTNYFMSALIRKSTKQDKIEVLKEITKVIPKMVKNEFASYPIQEFIKNASSIEEIAYILNPISNKLYFVEICNNQYGTHVIQKNITLINEKFRQKMNTLILSNLYSLLYNRNGICVVVKFITTTENEDILSFLLSYFSLKLVHFSKNKYINYAIQSLFKRVGSISTKFLNDIQHCILSNFFELSTNQFGNYIVKLILNYVDNSVKRNIFDSLKKKGLVFYLFNNKYSRCIIYKLIKGFAPNSRKKYLFYIKNKQNNLI